MSFYIQSIDNKDLEEMDSFLHDIYHIKKYLCDIGNTYLLVAYRVYEMSLNENYKKHNYKNIVEACQSELGWKKSTTYNMINIVKRFGKVENGKVTYFSLTSHAYRFSYSQLCEMLSLSDNQIKNITPDITIKEIRQMKKVQTSGQKENVIDTKAKEVVDEVVSDLNLPEVQTSGQKENVIDVKAVVKEVVDESDLKLSEVQTSGTIELNDYLPKVEKIVFDLRDKFKSLYDYNDDVIDILDNFIDDLFFDIRTLNRKGYNHYSNCAK